MTHIEIQVKCHSCNKTISLTVEEKGYLAWRKGEILIQKALPELSPAERELLISHTCGSCFDEMCAEE